MNAEIIKQAAEKKSPAIRIKRIYNLKSMIIFSGSKESTATKEIVW